MNTVAPLLHIVFMLGAFSSAAQADVRLVAFGPGDGPGGAAPPPAVLGDYAMTPFPDLDGGADFDLTRSVASPLGGQLSFNQNMQRRTVGRSWSTWSSGHDWAGNVYWSGSINFIDIGLPPETRAFYLYGHAPSGGVSRLRVTSQTGETVVQLTTALGGARGFGLYVTDPAEVLTTVRVSSEFLGFAVGEFGIAIPEPATAGLVLGGAAFLRRRGASAR